MPGYPLRRPCFYCAQRRQSRPGPRRPASRSAGSSVAAAGTGCRAQKRRCQRQFPVVLFARTPFLACALSLSLLSLLSLLSPSSAGQGTAGLRDKTRIQKGSKKQIHTERKRIHQSQNPFFFLSPDNCVMGAPFGGSFFFSRPTMRAIAPRAQTCEKDRQETTNNKMRKKKKTIEIIRKKRRSHLPNHKKRGGRIAHAQATSLCAPFLGFPRRARRKGAYAAA